ncbi:MAG TPA: class I SAM-dependent methyltransferase [Chitinophagaceae bacterium]|nr:class I SAM-dependent methyltransferase [Chitinophagaceae bacterium]
MQTDYYHEYYQLERTNWWFIARKKILEDQIKKIFPGGKTARILNVGAALGASTIWLQQFGTVESIEYSKECCDYVNENLGLHFVHGSITSLPFEDGQFDLVCAFDVVEHVEEDKLAISELHRVCKPGGYVFTTVPTFKFLWSEHDVVNEHKRRYTMRNYLSLFDKSISKIRFKSFFNFFLFPPIALFRVVSSALKSNNSKKPATSDNSKLSDTGVSKILYRIFRSETGLLKRGIKLPVGVSLMVISKKL